jgi:hypothetical protein
MQQTPADEAAGVCCIVIFIGRRSYYKTSQLEQRLSETRIKILLIDRFFFLPTDRRKKKKKKGGSLLETLSSSR